MKRTAIALITLIAMSGWVVASERRDSDLERLQSASTVLSQIMSAPDRGIPDSIMSGAKCIAVMPSMLKASFVLGANYGKGVATCRTATGWSAPAFFKLTGGSFGFQAGGQASDLVLIVRTDDGMQYLLQSKFKLGADASAAAGPVGRDAQAMTDLTLRAQVLTYSRSRGLFLGVSLSGGVIKQDQADTTAFYGKDWTYYSVLNGQVPAPADAEAFLKTVEKYAPTPPQPKAATTPSATPSAQTTTPADSTTTTASAAPPTTSASAAVASEPTTGTMNVKDSAPESDSAATETAAPAAATTADASAAPMKTVATPAATSAATSTPAATPATVPAQSSTPATAPAEIAPAADSPSGH
jgi:lipid-binding SYLF domain-containing protein